MGFEKGNTQRNSCYVTVAESEAQCCENAFNGFSGNSLFHLYLYKIIHKFEL